MTASLALIRSLFAPDEMFETDTAFRLPRLVLLMLILFAALVAGSLSASFHTNEVAEELLLQRELNRIERVMLNAPTEQREEAMAQIRRQISQGSGVISIVTGAVGTVVAWLIVFYELWLITILLIQFAGGEERPLGPDRHARSRHLVLTAMIPLIVAELLRALVLIGTDPEVYRNAATYTDYQEAVAVTLSVFSVAGVEPTDLAPFPRFLLTRGGSPFVWWAVYVFAAGATEVFRIRLRRALMIAMVLFMLLALQSSALQAVGNLFSQIGG